LSSKETHSIPPSPSITRKERNKKKRKKEKNRKKRRKGVGKEERQK